MAAASLLPALRARNTALLLLATHLQQQSQLPPPMPTPTPSADLDLKRRLMIECETLRAQLATRPPAFPLPIEGLKWLMKELQLPEDISADNALLAVRTALSNDRQRVRAEVMEGVEGEMQRLASEAKKAKAETDAADLMMEERAAEAERERARAEKAESEAATAALLLDNSKSQVLRLQRDLDKEREGGKAAMKELEKERTRVKEMEKEIQDMKKGQSEREDATFLSQLKDEAPMLRGVLERTERDLAAANASLHITELQLEQANTKLAEANARAEEATSKIAEADARADAANAKAAEASTKVEELSAGMAMLAEQIDGMAASQNAMLEEKMKQLEETRTQLSALQQVKKSPSNEDAASSAALLQNLKSENERLGKEAEEAKARAMLLATQAEQLNATPTVQVKSTNSPGLEEKVKQLSAALEMERQKRADADALSQELEELKSILDEREAALKQARSTSKHAEEERNRLLQQLDALQWRIEELESNAVASSAAGGGGGDWGEVGSDSSTPAKEGIGAAPK